MQPLKKIFEIAKEDSREIIQPVLHIRVGEKHFSCATTDLASGELKGLFYWTAGEMNSSTLADIFTQQGDVNTSFYQVKLCYDYPGNMLLPSAGFRQEEAGLLKPFFPGTAVTITEQVPAWQLYNVYSVPKDVHDLFTSRFPSVQCWHQATVGLRNMNAASAEGCFQVDIRHNEFLVIAAKGGALLLAQPFEYSTPEDVLYYLLKIARQFSLSQNQLQVELSGLIDKQSALYKDLYQYFANISFRDADWKMNDPGYPAHFFTSLNDLSRCVS